MKGILKKQETKKYLLYALPAMLLFIAICKVAYTYNQYLIEKQQKEFLRLAHSVSYGIEEIIEAERSCLEACFKDFVPTEEMMRQYLNREPDKRNQILLTDGRGSIQADIRNPSHQEFFDGEGYPCQDEFGEKVSVGRAIKLAEHSYGVPLICRLSEDRYLILIMNLCEIQDYLNRVMEDEGGKGYIALKTQDGYLISHKNPEQIGLHMVEGRREKYPDLDLSYLENVLEIQLSGQESAMVYDSYWFSEEPVTHHKKISVFTPLYLEHEFWVLTINLEYGTYILPLWTYMGELLFLTIGILAIMFGLIFRLEHFRQEQKRTERENQYLKELNKALDERNLEQEQKIQAGKLSQIGSMAGKISHDFRNFLMPVIGHAEFLAEDCTLPQRAQEDAVKILDYAEKASDLVTQLSRLSRYEKLQVPYVYFNILGVLKKAADSVKLVAPENVELQLEGLNEDIWIYGNETQIQEVLWNLMTNALDAMKISGGILSINSKIVAPVDLSDGFVEGRYDTEYLEISVTDTGTGIEEEIREKIFDPFFTTKEAGHGTGLGLSIARDIMIQHQGVLDVVSTIGCGSRFYFRIPCRRTLHAIGEKGISRAILLVTAAPLRGRLKYFKQTGYLCKRVADWEEAIKELENNDSYGYLFAEYENMERENNIFLHIRRNYPWVKIYVMTEPLTKQILELQKRLVISGYLRFPFSASDVEILIKGNEDGQSGITNL